MPAPFSASQKPATRAFTLVEVLVCMSILLLVTAILASMVNATSSVWQQTVGKVEQFREARTGFESITRRLSQATLNTYWDYHYPNNDPTKPADRYVRQSELRFISGPNLVAGTDTTSPTRPTHSVFFQAPLGFVMPETEQDTTYQNYRGMENLLNTWGYYVEYNSDSTFRPSFVTTPARSRFRLMEFMESTQTMSLYSLQIAAGGNAKYKGTEWFYSGINAPVTPTTPVHVLAENVIALVVLPKLSAASQTAGTFTDASLAPTYRYDSTGTGMKTIKNPKLNPTHQLPPIVQVTMVAMDELSAARQSEEGNQAIIDELEGLFSDAARYNQDLFGDPKETPSGGFAPFLQNRRINYRVFTTEVSIKGAKWSTE